MYLDVSKDNVVSALDALLVINYLNAGLAISADAPEGEGAAAVDLSLLAWMADEAVENKRKRA